MRFALLFVVLATTSCATAMQGVRPGGAEDLPLTEAEDRALGEARAWSTAELAILDSAIARAERIAADTAFLQIVRESAVANEIVWRKKNLTNLPDTVHRRATEWILQRFREAGHFRTTEIRAGEWEFDPAKKKSTRAMTPACLRSRQPCTTFSTRFHPAIVRSDALNALANTVIHERIHAFGQRHISQKRRRNRCEAPSVIGDVAESLLAWRDQGQPIEPRQTLCRTLAARLRARGIVR
ncbi:MAG TPA: hypothetical protein VGB66_18630 [Longimicrobium sp.]